MPYDDFLRTLADNVAGLQLVRGLAKQLLEARVLMRDMLRSCACRVLDGITPVDQRGPCPTCQNVQRMLDGE